MNVGDLPILSLLDERRSPDVIPHLSTHHGEGEEEADDAPHVLVVEELKIITTEVEETGDLEIISILIHLIPRRPVLH
jgi:hypothetical protein